MSLLLGLSRQGIQEPFGHCASAFVQTAVAALRRVMIGLRTLPARRTAYACQHEPDRRAAGICRRLGCVIPRHRCDRLRSGDGAVGIARGRLRRRADGNAAALELKPDGRFNYALSYGALDEGAAGRWTA